MPLEALRYDVTPLGLHYLLIHFDIPLVDPATYELTIRAEGTKRLRLSPNRPYCVAGKVNSVHTLYLVIESLKLDTKHEWLSTTPVPADGAVG